MEKSLRGLRRYLYEYQFFLEVEGVQRRSGKVVTVSAARALRTRLDEALSARGAAMSDARLGLADMQAAMHEVFAEVPGYSGTYADPDQRGAENAGYRTAREGFFGLAGFDRTPSHESGPLLAISPYDPRWSSRHTVKQQGAKLLLATDADVEASAYSEGLDALAASTSDFDLHVLDGEGRLTKAGKAYTRDDASGLTELMGYMTQAEYKRASEWVLAQPDADFMSEKGLARAKAVLEELTRQGASFRISRDRNRGQLVAHVEGTKISVRITDARAKEHFVGRVYDDGIATYFSTNHRAAGRNEYELYEPTPAETVDLLRIAQGLPVERIDGKGLVGVYNEPGDAYFTDTEGGKASRFAFGDYMRDGQVQRAANGVASRVFVQRKSDRSESSTWFANREEGRKFVELAVATARLQATNALDVEPMIAAFEANREAAEAGEWFPEFSGEEQIAAIQRGYWDVLRGAQTTLLRPGASREEYDDAVASLSAIDVSGATLTNVHDMLAGDVAYTGTPAERVRAHSVDVIDAMVGTYEPRETIGADGGIEVRTFDPAAVAHFMTSPYGEWRNSADLIAALRTGEATPEELSWLQGDNAVVRRVRDDLIEFDQTSARTIEDLPEGSFLREMATVAAGALERNGIEVTSLALDDNGILDWRGFRRDQRGRQLVGYYKAEEELHGQIGQLFERGEHGEVTTAFASGANYMFVPGYEARIVPQQAGEDLTMEERTRLRGYEQIMADQIRYQLAGDSLTKRTEVGGPTVLNGVYRRLYDERHEVDFLERASERGLDRGWAEAVLATEGRRVRYPNRLSDTMFESWAADNGVGNFDPANDSFDSTLVLTGGRNTAIMDERSDGYFDPDLTNAARPGVARFLVESATVAPDGSIVPGDKDDRTPVMKHPELAAIRFDPYDRRQMTGMNLMHASGVTRPRGTALMTFGGWGADDGIVVSADFAREHRILGKDGQMRDLVVGDKLSDLHGNKGVISLIVDRDHDYENALADQDQSMMYAAGIFRSNPDLDVVMSPFSAVGRFNGGTARELMDGVARSQDGGQLTLPFKGARPGLLGEMRFIVTHKDVQAGTRVYDEDALAQGRGRKASAQLAWALHSQGAREVMREFYGPNAKATANFRELLVSVGMDMEPTGELVVGRAQKQDARRVFPTPELVLSTGDRLDRRAMLSVFAREIGARGGDMELPFPLRFPALTRDKLGREIPEAIGVAEGAAAGEKVWRLPVMSSQLRTGQMLEDGTTTAHEYTTQYLKIFEAASTYRYAQTRLADENAELSPAQVTKQRERAARAVQAAQAAFSTITSGVIDRQFSGRSNIFKEGLMSSRLPSSATAVWSADPRLAIDQVAMSQTMATAMGVGVDDYVLVWRDPVLRDAGVRYMRVSIDDRLTGVAINPVMDKSFDGDFDGDSVAIVKLQGDKAHAEAMRTLTVEANLLDLGAVENVKMGDGRTEELYPLMMQDSLDVKVTQHVAPKYLGRFGDLTMRANEIHSDFLDGELSASQRLAANREVMAELSEYYTQAMEGQYGDAALRFDDPVAHLQSVKEACIDTGAKGSPAKLVAYAKHFGAHAKVEESGALRVQDTGAPLHTREEDQGVMVATAVKTAVGIAGAFSQRGVRALRNVSQKSVLELTYPVTQSLLQSKHDPHEAMQKYDMLLSSTRELWRGREMKRAAGPDGSGSSWVVVTDDKGAEVQATRERWEEQFLDMYRSRDGLNIPGVNPAHVTVVADALVGPDGRMRNIEEVGEGSETFEEGHELATGSTMDRLAYGGDFYALAKAARFGENIFAGEHNGYFAPFEIQRNQREQEQYERRVERAADDTRSVPGPEFVSVAPRDVLSADNVLARDRGTSRRSALAVAVRAPQRITEPEVEQGSSEGDYELVL